MTPLAPMNSTMPNSLTVSSRQRLPPATIAGSAAGRMTGVLCAAAARRAGCDFDLTAVDEREGGEQRTRHEGVEKSVTSARMDAPGRIEKIDRRMLEGQARGQRAVEYAGRAIGKVKASVTRKVGSAMKVSMTCATDPAPGNGAKARSARASDRGSRIRGRGDGDFGGVERSVEKRPGIENLERRAEIESARIVDERSARDEGQRVEEEEPREHAQRRRDPPSAEAHSGRARRQRDGVRHPRLPRSGLRPKARRRPSSLSPRAGGLGNRVATRRKIDSPI